ncbi:MAG: VOC family protein [Candidatus Aenigmarchaeota archaeon]|nr:VOC family protein [Candidatus Aenigmarchaeota archaeon]
MKFNKLIPELSVSNLKNSLNFYTKILGFKIDYEREESKFALLSFQGSQIMIEQANGNWETGKLEYPFGRGINFQIEVADVEPLIQALKENNYPIKVELQDNWYRIAVVLAGNREFLVMDPDGYLLRFFQDLGTKQIESSNKLSSVKKSRP